MSIPSAHLGRLKSVSGGVVRDVNRLYSVTGGVPTLELGSAPPVANVFRASFPVTGATSYDYGAPSEQEFDFSPAPAFPSSLATRGAAYFGGVFLGVVTSLNQAQATIYILPTADSVVYDAPELSPAWESNDTAFVVRTPTEDFIFPGPNSSLLASRDVTAPYVTSIPLTSGFTTWIESLDPLDNQEPVEFIFTDGAVPPRSS